MIISGNYGETIRISGNGFYDITNVVFGGNVTGEFTVLNSNLLLAKVPEYCAYGKIQIISSNRNVTGVSPFEFVPIPKIDGFTPTSGVPSTTILILGRGFSGVTRVDFNNIEAEPINVLSNDIIQAPVPNGNTRGYITVWAASGILVNSTQEFSPLAKITGFSPANGAIVGTNLSIQGVNFNSTILYNTKPNHVLVKYNGATGEMRIVSSTELTGIVPLAAQSGIISLYDELSGLYPSALSYNIIPSAPTIQNITPSSGKIGQIISVSGENFVNISSIYLSGQNQRIELTGLNSTSYGVTSNSLSFAVPNAVFGYYQLGVVTAGGTGTLNSGLKLLGAPTISGFSPATGVADTVVRITGQNLYGLSSVRLNSPFAKALTISGYDAINDSYLDVVLPSGAYTINRIYVNNTVSTAVSSNFLYYVPAPVIQSFSPTYGMYDAQVKVSGYNFRWVTGVKFGEELATWFKVNDTGVYFYIPDGALSNSFSVHSSGGSATTGIFEVYPPYLSISGFSPATIQKGYTLFISGLNIDTANRVGFTVETGVAFTSAFTRVTSGIFATVPQDAVLGKVYIGNKSNWTYSTNDLTIIQPPTISGFTPLSGYYQQVITITGNNFNPDTRFYFMGPTGEYVYSTGTSIASLTSATTYVPREIVTAQIMTSGVGDTSTSSGVFVPLPTIVSFTPSSLSPETNIQLNVINGYEMSPYYLIASGTNRTGALQVQNVLDDGIILTINNENVITGSNHYTLVSGKVGPFFIGTGKLAVRTSYDTSWNLNLMHYGVFSTGNLIVSGSRPRISGIFPSGGGYTDYITISGEQFYEVTGVKFYNPVTSNSTYAGIYNIADNKTMTIQPPDEFEEGFMQVSLWSPYSDPLNVDTKTFLNKAYPWISDLSTGTFTIGASFDVNGANLMFIDRVELFQTNTNPVPLTFSVIADDITTYHVNTSIPNDYTLKGQTFGIRVSNGFRTGEYGPIYISP